MRHPNQFSITVLVLETVFIIPLLSAPAFGSSDVPAVQICGNNLLSAKAVDDGITYNCEKPCLGSVESCTRCESGFCNLTFTVEGAGGNLYYNPIPGAPTLLFHFGAGGTQRYAPEVFAPLRKKGLKVVEVEWAKGGNGKEHFRPTQRPGLVHAPKRKAFQLC